MENKKLINILIKDLKELEWLLSEIKNAKTVELLELEFIQAKMAGVRKLLEIYGEWNPEWASMIPVDGTKPEPVGGSQSEPEVAERPEEIQGVNEENIEIPGEEPIGEIPSMESDSGEEFPEPEFLIVEAGAEVEELAPEMGEFTDEPESEESIYMPEPDEPGDDGLEEMEPEVLEKEPAAVEIVPDEPEVEWVMAGHKPGESLEDVTEETEAGTTEPGEPVVEAEEEIEEEVEEEVQEELPEEGQEEELVPGEGQEEIVEPEPQIEVKFQEQPNVENESQVLGEKFQKEKSVNDVKYEGGVKLEEKLSSMPLKSIKSAIGINDRFLFTRELFDGNPEIYDKAVTKLDSMDDIKDAVVFLRDNFKWKKNETSLKFVDLVKRRFLNE